MTPPRRCAVARVNTVNSRAGNLLGLRLSVLTTENEMHRIARALAAIGLLACLSPAVQAQAQAVAYPSRPVTIRVAYPPGGPADVAINQK